jgi:pimeloyl-ACP methyl ester carboxylesterase
MWASVFIDMGVARIMLALRGVHDSFLYLILQSKYVRARASELEQIHVSAEQARAADHVGDKPLVVLSAGKISDATLINGLSRSELDTYEQTWVHDLQPRLARLSNRGKQIIVPDSGHDMPSDRPDAIVQAVREIAAP